MTNLYWPVYKNLEREILSIAEYIHFDDKQANVYSMKIGNFIVRCSIEIESISKELYLLGGGNPNPTDASTGRKRDLYFDTDCIDLLNNKWEICSKKLTISATNFYFTDEKYRTIVPLHKANKRGSSGSKWKQAYQNVKHDRKNQLKVATIENLIHALGALYILNIYYKNETIKLSSGVSEFNFDTRCGSEIFSVSVCNATKMNISENSNDNSINKDELAKISESIYIVKYTDEALRSLRKENSHANKVLVESICNSPEVINYLNSHKDYRPTSLPQLCFDAGVGKTLLHKFANEVFSGMQQASREAVLYKGRPIYKVE